MNKKLRSVIIALLDDEHGINDAAYTQLFELATETGNQDVINAAECQNNRWFLGEDDAEELRNK